MAIALTYRALQKGNEAEENQENQPLRLPTLLELFYGKGIYSLSSPFCFLPAWTRKTPPSEILFDTILLILWFPSVIFEAHTSNQVLE